MTQINELRDQKIVVVGLNTSGAALAQFCAARGAQVSLVDTRNTDELRAEGVKFRLDISKVSLLGRDVDPRVFFEAALIVLTPQYRARHELVEQARAQGVPIISELEFVARHTETPIIAITGTNGKSTTAALLSDMLEIDGKSVYNNIEQPLAGVLLTKASKIQHIVAVTNVFQAAAIKTFKPYALAILNTHDDYLNVFPSSQVYKQCFLELTKNIQDDETLVVLNTTDTFLMEFRSQIRGKHLYFALQEDLNNHAWCGKQHLHARKSDGDILTINLANFRLRGPHNRENLLVAVLLAMQLGVKQESMIHTIENMRALHSRVQFVKRHNFVAFYNDSCSSNVDALIATLNSFSEPIILIAGGKDRNLAYEPLASHIRQRVKDLILIGESKEKINRMIGDFTETFIVGSMEEAIMLSYQKSRSGDVILLSPGCDGIDMFSSHYDRGAYFIKLVDQITRPRNRQAFV